MPIELSERQHATVAVAITIVATVVIAAAIGGVLLLIALFVTRFSAVFLPLAVAAVAAMVFKPYFRWLTDRLRLPTPLAVVALFLSVLLPLVGFGWFFGSLIVDQVAGLLSQVPAWWAAGVELVQERAPRILEWLRTNPVVQALRGSAGGPSTDTMVQGLQLVGGQALAVGAKLLAFVGGLLGWVVTPVYFVFFLLADEQKLHRLDAALPFLKPSSRDDVVYLVQEFVGIVVSFFRGQLIIAFLQGLLFAVGFSLVGLSYGFVIGLTLGFLNIIPYLGNIVGLGTALPLAFFQQDGGIGRVLAVLAVVALVQAVEAYLLTPRIMGQRTGLHPLVIIVAIFFWGSALGGIMGMILAIPLTAFLVVVWRLFRQKYVREVI